MNTNTEKILIVEDEPAIATLYEFNLKKEGFSVVVAHDGKNGLDLVKENNFDLILSDIMMPIMDGYQFRKALLDDEKNRYIPFIFLTAKASENDILEGYNLGIDEYIIKNSPKKIVVAKIKAVLASKAKRKKEAVNELNEAVNNLASRVVPDKPPIIQGFSVNHWHKSFDEIPGGDFIDYIETPTKNIIVLGDVMGKKWNAWYFALAYAGYIRSSVRVAIESSEELSPSTVLSRVNKTVYNDERIAEIFTTISIVCIDKATSKVMYSGAGDLPILLKKKNENNSRQIQSGGLLMGFSGESEYNNIEINFKSGDSLYLFTDGILESENNEGEFFGFERFINLANTYSGFENSIEKIKSDFKKFTNNNFSDDISLVCLKKD